MAKGATGLLDKMQMDSNGKIDLKAVLDDIEAVTDEAPLAKLRELIKKDWQKAYNSRAQSIEPKILQNMRQVEGEYDPDHLAAILSAPGPKPLSPIYMMITANIAKTGEARVQSILTQSDDPPVSLVPEPVPELSPDVEREIISKVLTGVIEDIAVQSGAAGMPLDEATLLSEVGTRQNQMSEHVFTMKKKEAQSRAGAMEREMRTQLDEGGFDAALNECIVDFFQQKTVIMEGPILRNEKVIRYDGEKINVVDEEIYEWERIDPILAYPLIGTTMGRNGRISGGIIILKRMTRQDLNGLIGVPGYDEDAIRDVLDQYKRGGLHDWTTQSIIGEMDSIKDTPYGDSLIDDNVDALHYHNWVYGGVLRDFGMTAKQIPDPNRDYPVSAVLIGSHIIKCSLNSHPLGELPFSVTSFDKVPGSFWGNSMPEKVRGPVMLCNGEARAIQRNSAISSGPQVVIDKSLVPIGADMSLYPFKHWVVDGSKQNPMNGGSGRAPIQFFYPPMVLEQLMAAYDKFEQKAYDMAGIPKPIEVPTSGDSPASTHSMAQTDKNKVIQLMVDNIERDLIASNWLRLYVLLSKYSKKKEIKGACKVKVNGIHYLAAKEQRSIRLQEFMGAVAQSPVLQEIMGKGGVAKVIEERVKDLGVDPDDAIQGVKPGQPVPPAQNAVAPAGTAPPPNPVSLDAAGSPVAGRDTSTFPN
jgi:hypothetical protein